MATFQVGDRVILRNLQSKPYLNGMHGTVGGHAADNGRYPVDLDLLLTDVTRLGVKPQNLEKEPPICTERRAETSGGSLVEMEGRTCSIVLDCVRLGAADYAGETGLTTLQDIAQLRLSHQGFLLQNRLTSIAWTFFSKGHEGYLKGVPDAPLYDRLVKFLRELPELNGGFDKLVQDFPEYPMCLDAVERNEAAKGWNVRVTGDFWIVGMDEDGTFLIPDSNHNVVYQCCGLKDPIYPKVVTNRRPICLAITMIPWYGRLVYDGVMVPPNGLMQPPMASASLTRKLNTSLELAQEEGRVISRLAQLEVTGGSLLGVHDLIPTATEPRLASEDQPPATKEEESLRKKLVKCKKKDQGLWVLRRWAYTERENPDFRGVIMAEGGVPVCTFNYSALAPTAADVLKAVLAGAKSVGYVPQRFGVDDRRACDRVEFLLKDLDGLDPFYYPPPTAEETTASMALGNYNTDRIGRPL